MLLKYFWKMLYVMLCLSLTIVYLTTCIPEYSYKIYVNIWNMHDVKHLVPIEITGIVCFQTPHGRFSQHAFTDDYCTGKMGHLFQGSEILFAQCILKMRFQTALTLFSFTFSSIQNAVFNSKYLNGDGFYFKQIIVYQ